MIQTEERRGVITFENLDSRPRLGADDPALAAVLGDSIVGGIFTTRNTDDPTINNAYAHRPSEVRGLWQRHCNLDGPLDYAHWPLDVRRP